MNKRYNIFPDAGIIQIGFDWAGLGKNCYRRTKLIKIDMEKKSLVKLQPSDERVGWWVKEYGRNLFLGRGGVSSEYDTFFLREYEQLSTSNHQF